MANGNLAALPQPRALRLRELVAVRISSEAVCCFPQLDNHNHFKLGTVCNCPGKDQKRIFTPN
jgi:hypothetical protein